MPITLRSILKSNEGQALIELMLIAPLMIVLAFGAIEVGSVISTHLTLTHTTREGANLASRSSNLPIHKNGADNDILDAVIKAAGSTLGSANQTQWRVIYTRVIQDPMTPCVTEPCKYMVDNINPDGQVLRGDLDKQSKLGPPNGTQIPQSALPGIQNVKASQTFHVVEVFYDYAPNVITFVGKGINTDFYERSVFTNVSAN